MKKSKIAKKYFKLKNDLKEALQSQQILNDVEKSFKEKIIEIKKNIHLMHNEIYNEERSITLKPHQLNVINDWEKELENLKTKKSIHSILQKRVNLEVKEIKNKMAMLLQD